jgi:hypothetical protein
MLHRKTFAAKATKAERNHLENEQSRQKKIKKMAPKTLKFPSTDGSPF